MAIDEALALEALSRFVPASEAAELEERVAELRRHTTAHARLGAARGAQPGVV